MYHIDLHSNKLRLKLFAKKAVITENSNLHSNKLRLKPATLKPREQEDIFTFQ